MKVKATVTITHEQEVDVDHNPADLEQAMEAMRDNLELDPSVLFDMEEVTWDVKVEKVQ